MKNKKATSRQIKNAYCEHHSNLALLTAAVAMVAFMVLLVIYMGEFQNMNYYSYQKLEMSRGVSVGVGVASWVAAAVLSFVSVRKKKKYLVEYIVYAVVIGFGLFFLYQPGNLGFIFKLVQKTSFGFAWTRNSYKLLCILSAVYFVVSIVWHSVLSTPGKANKK